MDYVIIMVLKKIYEVKYNEISWNYYFISS